MNKLLAPALIVLLFATPAAASTIFSDDFESYAFGTPTLTFPGSAPGNWAVTPSVVNGLATIDVIGAGNGFNWYDTATSKKYIDLNGTPESPSRIATSLSVVGGQSYSVAFDYGNNKTYSNPEDLGFGIQGFSLYSIVMGGLVANLLHHTFNFTAASTGNVDLFFQDNNLSPYDWGGPILDNVAVATVPVPAALPLFISGIGLLGVLASRRKRPSRAVAA